VVNRGSRWKEVVAKDDAICSHGMITAGMNLTWNMIIATLYDFGFWTSKEPAGIASGTSYSYSYNNSIEVHG